MADAQEHPQVVTPLSAVPEPASEPQPAPRPSEPSEVAETGESGESGRPGEVSEPTTASTAADVAADAASRAAEVARDLGAAAGVGAARASEQLADATRVLAARRTRGVRNTPNRRRLRADLSIFTVRLQALQARTTRRSPWMAAADTLTVGAAEALRQHETVEAWSLLWAAEREALAGLGEDELVAESEATVREARYVLAPEQADAVARAMERHGEGARTLTSRVRAGRELFDRLRLETYRRLREEGRRLSGLGLLVVAFLVLAVAAVGFGIVDGGDGQVLGGLDDLLAVAGFGACGAIVSMLVPWSGSSNRPAVLDFINPIDLTVLRVATGAALAIALVVLLQVVQLNDVVGVQAYPWAFAAGFGERVIDKRLDAVDAAARDAEAG